MDARLDSDVFARGEPFAPEDDGGPSAALPPITVRDVRFGREGGVRRWWLDGDPVATAWHNALSATFPRGEAMFIEAVKRFRDGAPSQLAAQIRAFVKQEINHTREHLAFNRAAEAAGYDFSGIDARTKRLIDEVYAQPPIAWLAITVALEHFTAMFAAQFLSNPAHFHGGDAGQADLWRWHSVEEIEHKAAAYDTWLHATRDWSRWKRWRVKSALMLIITRRFVRNRSRDALDLLAQDGIAGARARLRLAWYLVGAPGMLRRVFPRWCAFFLPGFHPWRHDDRALVRLYDADAPATA